MESRERFRLAFARRMPDRVPMTEVCYWPQTLERWRREGLPPDADPLDHFGLDRFFIHCPFDASLRLPTRVVEDTEEWRVSVNSDGVTMKEWKKGYAPPSEIDFSIRTRDDWDAVKGRFEVSDGRFDPAAVAAWERARDAGLLTVVTPVEPVWYLLRTLGFERSLSAMALEPEWIEEALGTLTDFTLALLSEAERKGYRYDALWFSADLCYRNGMLFSPRFYRSVVRRFHEAFARYCRERDMAFVLHCDGDVREFIPMLIESGFDCIEPLEARAGNDVRELKERFGRDICFFGNMSMDVLARGDRGEIVGEVASKMEAAKAGGGYIWNSDHSVPPTVSFESYSLAVETARKHGGYR